MKPAHQTFLFVACLIVATVAVLSVVGVLVGSNWGTFVPDLIVAIVTAGGIAGLIAWVQGLYEQRRRTEDRITAAYESILDALTPLRTLDLVHGDASRLSALFTRLVVLYELVDAREPHIGMWFNAERQLGLAKALEVSGSLAALKKKGVRDADSIVEASGPFHIWVAAFTNNIRLWRMGRLTSQQMIEQARRIEANLRSKGMWKDTQPWDLPGSEYVAATSHS